MTVIQKLRIPLDITMTALSVILMGGTVLFPDDKVHQILGMALLALWAAHIALNRKWYGAVPKGKYNPYRIMQTVVNFGILLCAILLAVSGMMMAWFVPETVSVPLGFARTAHLVGSHWYYLFMSAHLGMHISVIFNRIKAKRSKQAKVTGVFDRLNHRATSARKIILSSSRSCALTACMRSSRGESQSTSFSASRFSSSTWRRAIFFLRRTIFQSSC